MEEKHSSLSLNSICTEHIVFPGSVNALHEDDYWWITREYNERGAEYRRSRNTDFYYSDAAVNIMNHTA